MSEPGDKPDNPRRRRAMLWGLLIALVAVVAGLLAWKAIDRKPDLEAAAHANARGLGYMEKFDEAQPDGKIAYQKAAEEFEQAAKLAPDWVPAKINLGIALYNTTKPEAVDRAVQIFEQVLAADPDNAHAHYNLGIIYLYRNNLPAAAGHFAQVTRIDPKDPHAWYHRWATHPTREESPETKEFLRKALELNPYFNAARYALAQHQHEYDAAKSKALLEEHRALVAANWESEYNIRYSEMGKYAECIGASPAPPPAVGPAPMFEKDEKFTVTLAAGTRWAKQEDFSTEELRKLVRGRFGGTVVRLDANKDGKPDLLLLSAVVREGKLADVLLHNAGGGVFNDVSAVVKLPPGASFGAAVGDFDNDGWPDLVLTGPSGIRLLRNEKGSTFIDKIAEAGFDKLTGVFLGATWVDLDQDGDLDLLLARYATSVERALKNPDGNSVVMLNVGEAPPAPPNEPAPPLSCKFQPADSLSLLIRAPTVGFVVADLDTDRDVDVVILDNKGAARIFLNDRLLRFQSGYPGVPEVVNWNAGLVLDSTGNERLDLFLIGPSKVPAFPSGATDSPPLVQGMTSDVNLDGRTDIVALSNDRLPVLLLGDGQGKLAHKPAAFGPAADAVPNLAAASALDYDSDGNPDLLLWSDGAGLTAFRNLGVGNRGVRVELTGRRDKGSNLRTNSDGVGATVTVHAGPLRTTIENTTLDAGLGQSRLPLAFGIGKANAADAVRVRWPDGVPQSELNVPSGQLTKIVELNRKGTSCPVLFAWDGERFRYITDFLGGGALGEWLPDGSLRPPRPEESVKIEPGQLALRDGRYVVKIAEPMDEVLYLDHLRLDVIDHPAEVEVHPDERFATGGPAPTQTLLAFAERLLPNAVDHRGRDATETLHARDGRMVSGFLHRSWLGFAEEHFVELDFANVPGGDLHLVLAGWIDYPYPESIFAATQAGVPMQPPVLERRTAAGTWEKVADLGFPAGLPKVMVCPVPGLSGERDLKLRIRTNLQVYWDQIYLAAAGPAKAATLTVSGATLAHRGFVREVTRGPTIPIEYDDTHTETVAVTPWQGRLTRTGDVTSLLTGLDDQFVLNGPGDEITVEFDAAGLPPPKPGHVRSFVLRTYGYCKDTAPFTKTGGQVGPLPFRGMSSYPDGAADRSKAPQGQDAYDREWNTRPAGDPSRRR